MPLGLDPPVPPGTYDPPKKKRPDPVRDSPSDPGHGTPPVSGGGGGGGDPARDSPGDPGHGTSPTGSHKIPPAWVIRRQQVLLRAGYNISVDGVWGGKSQAAWARFTQGISSARANAMGKGTGAGFHPLIPPGMTIYNGRIVSKQAAIAAKAIADAKTNAAGMAERAMMRGLPALRQSVAASGGYLGANPTLQGNAFRDAQRVAAGGPTRGQLNNRNERFLDAMGNRLAHGLDVKDRMDRVYRLFGPEGMKALAAGDDQALRLGIQSATAHDISALLQDGLLDTRDHGDVRFIQAVVTHLGEPVKETGVIDNATGHAFEKLYAKEAAKEWTQGVRALKKQYFDSGIAQYAAVTIYGRRLSPAELYEQFVQGGPKAVRIARYLGLLYANTQAPVEAAIQRLARESYDRKYAGGHPEPFSHDEVEALIGKRYASALRSPTLTTFWTRMAVEFDQIERERKAREDNSSPGFWGNVLGKVATVGGWLSGPSEAAAGAVLGARVYVWHNLHELSPEITDLLSYSPGQRGFAPGGAGAVRTDEATAFKYGDGGFLSPGEAWRDGKVTLSEMQESDPLSAAILEGLVDPLNLVGTGIFASGATRAGRLWIDYSARGMELTGSGSRLFEASPDLALALNATFQKAAEVEHVVNDLSMLADYSRQAFDMTRTGRAFAKASIAKQSALERVSAELSTLTANGFRKRGALITVGQEAMGPGAAATRLASHIAKFERDQLARGTGEGFENAVDAELVNQLNAVHEDFATALLQPNADEEVATLHQLVSKMGSNGHFLYRHAERLDGRLSKAGVWLAAFLQEQHSRILFSALAHEMAGDNPQKLAGYLASLGTYAAGHPHYDFAELAIQAQDAFRKQVYEQILPALDNIAQQSDKRLQAAWDADGFLLDEGSDQLRDIIGKAMGFDLKTAFGVDKNMVKVPNPNHLIRVAPDVAQRLRAAEFDRRENSIIRWAEDAKWLNRDDAKATARINETVKELRAKLDLELADAWLRDEVTGQFFDARATLEVPKPYARGYYRPLGTESTGHVLGHEYSNETPTSVTMQTPDNIIADIAVHTPKRTFTSGIQFDGAQQIAIRIRQGSELLQGGSELADSFYAAAARWAFAHSSPGATLRPFLVKNETQEWWARWGYGDTDEFGGLYSKGMKPYDAARGLPEGWQHFLEDPPFGWESVDNALVRPIPPARDPELGDPRDYAVLSLSAPSALASEVQRLAERMIADPEGPIGELAALAKQHEELLANAKAQVYSKILAKHWLFLQSAHYSQHVYVRALYYGVVTPISMWKFVTLSLRPGYTVRNVIDNTTKSIVRGLKDPRAIFNPDGKSIFELAQYHMLIRATRAIDGAFGTNAAGALEHLVMHFWSKHPEELRRIIGEHGIPIPQVLYEDRTIRVLDREHFELSLKARNLTKTEEWFARRAELRGTPHATRFQKLQDNIWAMMGSGPENYAKRQLYVSTYKRVLHETGSDLEAYDAAMADVEHTLFNFDAANVSVLEDQLKVLFPFIAFWRKTARFWASEVVDAPQFYIQGMHMYNVHDASNADLPSWMRRYVSASPLASVGGITGLGWLGDFLRDSYTDPITLTSLGSFYRAFKSTNSNLPEDQLGSTFLAPFERAFNDFGLGINPYLRTIGSLAGVFDRRQWQSIFPQTSQLDAISQWAGFGSFNLEQMAQDEVIQALDLHIDTNQELNERAFNKYVQMEMAGQAARGEKVSRSRAEDKLRQWLSLQQLVGFTAGIYMRHLTDTDISLYTLGQEMHDGEKDFLALSDEEQAGYQLFKRRDLSPARFDTYRVNHETARIFYNLDTSEEQQRFLQDHPEILSIVHPDVFAKGYKGDRQAFVRDQLLISQTDVAFDLLDSFDDPHFDFKVGSAAYNAVVTDDLKAFWAGNDTSADMRQRTVAALVHRHYSKMTSAYFAIPSTDFEARSGYLAAHPELSRFWARNDTPSDDWKTIMGSINDTFRETYFSFVERGDWDSADAFLREHSFIFDFTSAEGRIDPEGHWIPESDAQKEYAQNAELLRVYYAIGNRHLRDQYVKTHPSLRRWLVKYGRKGTDIFSAAASYQAGGLDQHARDYLAIKPLLDAYFNLSDGEKAAYLAAHPELRNYFAKYSHERGMSQHAQDYLAIKPVMDAFFALPEGQRQAYLAKHPELQRYFDKYSSHKGGGSGHHASLRESLANNPEIADRYHFWMRYFALPPDKRGNFVHSHAAEAGIFIYGSLSYDDQMRKEARWKREAVATGNTPRAVAYMHIKPLMDVYFDLDGSEKTLFLQMNPELTYYFDHYAKNDGIPSDIQKQLSAYYRTQPFSDQRREYLDTHPDLQHFFSRDDSPTEKALHRMVEHYFGLPFEQRDRYVAQHPELGAFFDARTAQHDLFSSAAAAFNEIDPRMQRYYDQYKYIIDLDALKQFQLSLHHSKAKQITLSRDPHERLSEPRDTHGQVSRRVERTPVE